MPECRLTMEKMQQAYDPRYGEDDVYRLRIYLVERYTVPRAKIVGKIDHMYRSR